MNIAYVASEAVPFAKTGGLADVSGALPVAIRRLGVEACLILPYYREAARSIEEQEHPLKDTGHELWIPIGSRMIPGRILRSALPGSDVPVYLIDQPHYFDREGLYGPKGSDHPDNCERFCFFQRATLETIRLLKLSIDVIHCNDWQTGLIPIYLNTWYRSFDRFARISTILTVHNLAFQGAFWHLDMPITGLDWGFYNWKQLECNGQLNMLKAGLVGADLINTVSPTYSREIQAAELGCGLNGLLWERRHDLRGIVNGIDPKVWNPSDDRFLATNYGVDDHEQGKAAAKAALQGEAALASLRAKREGYKAVGGLDVAPNVPLLGQIGRLADQKGWDLLIEVMRGLLKDDVQLVVLGSGDSYYQDEIKSLAERFPGKVLAVFEKDEELAHRIEAGADLFLMPSRYEPCGLNQLYSLAYGAIPVVRRTGGLSDTVVDANGGNVAAGLADGVVFAGYSPQALREAIQRALTLWKDRDARRMIIRNAMKKDWTWDRSAKAYVDLYGEAARRRSG